MKFYSRSKKVITLLTVLSGVFIFSAEVLAANIKRSCSAHYYGTVNSIKFISNGSQRTLNIPYETINVSYREKEFSAQGGCGKLVPNRCRERARNKLLACAKAHANSPNQIPEACRPNVTKYYPIQNLRSVVKERACGKLTSKDGIRVTDLLSKPYQVNILLDEAATRQKRQ